MPTLSSLLANTVHVGIQGAQGVQGPNAPTNVGLTVNTRTTAYTLASGDVGEYIGISTGGITIPANTFSAGDVFTIYNTSGIAQTITVAAGASLYSAGSATTSRISMGGTTIVTVLCIATNQFIAAG